MKICNQERNDCNEVKYGAEDDFKYRYRKDDCLKPVLNLTLYWGRKKWKKPQALKDMMGNMGRLPEKLQRLAGDYPVHMVCMRGIPDEDIQKMDSDLRYVLGIMKRTASPKQYKEYIRKNGAYFSRMPKSAVDVIDACTNIKNITEKLEYTLNAETREEETDMCKALDEIEKNAVKRGLKKGVKQGRKQGERRGALMMLFSLVNDGLLNVGEAARRAKLSKDVFCTKMTKAGYKKPI